MALNWPDAGVAIRFERETREDERGLPPGTVVVVMRPDQVDDPDFVREMRRMVAARTIEREYETERDPARARGGEDGETCEEERRFVRNFLGEDEDPGGDDLSEFLDDILDETYGIPSWTPWQHMATRLVIGRCGQVVVGG